MKPKDCLPRALWLGLLLFWVLLGGLATGRGRWLPGVASASGSVLVSGWRLASVACEEHAAKFVGHRTARPGRCSQTPGSTEETAEPLEQIWAITKVEQSRLGRKKECDGPHEGKLSILRVFQRSVF